MIFVADIGNTGITLAAFEKDESLLFRTDISAVRSKLEDEYIILLSSIFSMYGINPGEAEGAIISSVVPPLTNVFRNAVSRLLKCKVMLVGPGIKTGLDIKIDNHSQLGPDLVANTVAASAKYNKPFIIIDMGTATTVVAVNEKSELCGVIILPGIGIALDALSASTSELPYISLDTPKALLGTNTVDAMNSGIVYGSACMLDGLIERLKEEFEGLDINIIATGGYGSKIIPYCRNRITYSPNLILEGLYMLYKRNQKKLKTI